MALSEKRRGIWAAVIAIAAVLALWILSNSEKTGQSLCLKDADRGYTITQLPLGEGGEFSVRFLHSVNKTEVREVYELREDGIYLIACVYESFGAGVAEDLPPDWELTLADGVMIISGIDMNIPKLFYYIGTIYDHILEIEGRDYSLTRLCGQNRRLELVGCR